ncbi:MAG: hypothetical protein ABIF22_02395 [bacterium]
MINQDLLNYIENEIARGTPKNIIQSNLLSNGWNEKDIAEAFSNVALKNHSNLTPPSVNNNIKSLPKYKKTKMQKLILLIFIAAIIYFVFNFFKSTGPISLMDSKNFNNEPSGINLVSTKLATVSQQILDEYCQSGICGMDNVQFTNDGRKVLFGNVLGNEIFINEKSGSYSYTTYGNFHQFYISPDQQKIAWGAKRGSDEFAVLNFNEGQKISSSLFNFNIGGPPPPDKITHIYFSPDSSKMAYIVYGKQDGSYVVEDDSNGNITKGNTYFLLEDPIVFSPDSSKMAYKADITQKSQKVIINGVEGKEYRHVYGLTFSPDSSKFVYTANGKPSTAINNVEKNQIYDPDIKSFIVVNGVESKMYEPDTYSSVTFSPDSLKLVYVARENKKSFLVINDQEIKNNGTYSEIEHVVISSDSKNIAYSAYNGSSWKLVINGQESVENYPVTLSPIFSSDSKKIAFIAGDFGNNYIVVITLEDGKKTIGKAYNSMKDLQFSPNSQNIAYIAKDNGEDFVVLNSVEGKKYNEPEKYSINTISNLAFSPDSQKLAYIVKQNNKMIVVANEKEGELYDYISYVVNVLTFSADSKKVMYGARKGNEFWWVVDDLQ